MGNRDSCSGPHAGRGILTAPPPEGGGKKKRSRLTQLSLCGLGNLPLAAAVAPVKEEELTLTLLQQGGVQQGSQ